jgi:hypothetical protein
VGKDKVFRVAPSRSGVQIANAWRIWAQGSEFYAAARDVIRLGKISFHSNFYWRYEVGDLALRLAEPLKLTSRWLHALELVFLIDTGVLLPLTQCEAGSSLVETPEGAKLVLNLLLSSDAKGPRLSPPPEIGGHPIHSYRLRSGATLLVVARVMPLDNSNQALIAETRAKLRVNVKDNVPSANVYVEASWNEFSPRTGNVLAVIPVGTDSLAVEGRATASRGELSG